MFKVIWLVKFQPDVPRDDVVRWWRDEHGPMAARIPGMVRYVQSVWTEPLDQKTQLPIPKGECQFDGHAEHWFTDFEAYKAAMTSAEWQETHEDGPRAFDTSTLVGGVLSEHVVL